jgi:hypothetical protein
MICKVVAVIQDWNMNLKHELRESPTALNLKSGQCIVAINTRRNMARVICSEGGVHDYYADQGVKFDVGELSQMMQRGIGLELKYVGEAKAA